MPLNNNPAQKLLSVATLVAVGALIVAGSVPANAFMTTSLDGPQNLSGPSTSGERYADQSIYAVAAPGGAAVTRDGYEVVLPVKPVAASSSSTGGGGKVTVDFTYVPTSGAVRWPFPNSVPINDGFGYRSDGFHKGIDMMAGGGTPVYAIADGIATTSVYDGSGYGQHVVIQHNINGTDVESLYAHFVSGSSPIVPGQVVKVGDFLGLVGDTGYATVAHLHFEIHINKSPVDPFAWLQANAV